MCPNGNPSGDIPIPVSISKAKSNLRLGCVGWAASICVWLLFFSLHTLAFAAIPRRFVDWDRWDRDIKKKQVTGIYTPHGRGVNIAEQNCVMICCCARFRWYHHTHSLAQLSNSLWGLSWLAPCQGDTTLISCGCLYFVAAKTDTFLRMRRTDTLK